MIGKTRLKYTAFKRGLLILGGALLFCVQALAGTLTGEIDKIQGSVEDEFVYTLTASGKVDGEPKFPNVPGLTVEQTGKASNFSLINGAMSREVEYRFTIIPEKPGSYTIPSLTMKIDGKNVSTLPITFKVAGESSAPQPGTQVHKNADVFIERTLSKETAYVGEPIISTIRLYHRVPLLQANAKPTDISGMKRIPVEGEKTYQKAINGQQYRVIEMKEVLVPNEPGNREIEPFAVAAIVSDPQPTRTPRPDSLFDSVFSRGRQMKKNVRSNMAQLQVKALPKEGRTSHFSGLVGEFAFNADLSTQEVKAGDTVTLTLNVGGNNYTDGLKTPNVELDPSIKVYADKPVSQEHVTETGVQSSRTIKFALVPDKPGEFQIPPVQLEVFNTAKGAYETLVAKIPPLKVKGTAGTSATPPQSTTAAQKDVKAVGEDLLPIRSIPAGLGAQTLSTRDYMWGFGAIFFAAVFAAGSWTRARLVATSSQRQKRRRKDKALDAFQRRLKHASPKDAASVTTLGLALKEFIGTKAECRGESLTPKEAVAVLQRVGVGEKIQKDTHEWFTRLERFEYGGQTPEPEQWQSLTQEAKKLAEGMQKEWRAHTS